MPRPKTIQNRGFISLIIENKYVELLDKIARREGITKSELVRRVIIEWLENEAKVRYGLEEVFAVAQASDAPRLLPLVAKRVTEIETAQKEIARQLVELKRYFEPISPDELKTMSHVVDLWRQANESYNHSARWTKINVSIGGVEFSGYVKDFPREQYAVLAGKVAEFWEKVKLFKALRAKFFKEVYYKYRRDVKDDIPYEKRQELESFIARQLEIIDMIERKLRELGVYHKDRRHPGKNKR
jgi:hypothetical protein